jgi:hypothetical protein
LIVGHQGRRLSRADVALLIGICVVQTVVGTAVRVVPVRVLSRAIARCRVGARRMAMVPEERIAWAIEAVGRRLTWISTCLVRALVADLFLGGAECSGRVKIGVRRSEQGMLESHAWFERDGRILVGAVGVGEYVEFVTLPIPESRIRNQEFKRP